MIKILLGGSPCTFWSLAQTKNRETEAKGLGWELFKNYLIAKQKFKPDFFLYENNKSAAKPIKEQIAKDLSEALETEVSTEFVNDTTETTPIYKEFKKSERNFCSWKYDS